MAAISSTVTICSCRKTWFFHNPNTFPKQSIFLATNRRSFSVSNSVDANASSAQTESADVESQSPIETPQGTPSLISALNVERALRGIAITDVDHYGRLGLLRGCSYDQIADAYRKNIEEVMNRGLEEEEVQKEMELLNESHSILSSVEERRMYDWSLARSEAPDRYVWPFEIDITQTPTQPPPPQVQHPS
ncbi:NAD(P)H-quinone oxidoreductase subunit U, chloroplastic isoform X2 [Carica papaya]|uniref:NAD(P)H-quinone oxidoreductase subunit U, chloroplastic isoform X2 n=1 Tax=Carica papaya TaxID=3649 RepID=UPI000B8CE274|nr:NAD(P)H-quinone oxidoreductase subunit U, chloroplastic isoform X2 [Carica papaya]